VLIGTTPILGRSAAEGVARVARLHELIGAHLDDDSDREHVAIGVETDRGPGCRRCSRPYTWSMRSIHVLHVVGSRPGQQEAAGS
jgi:hypothetical protein